MSTLAEYFTANRPKPKYNVGDRVFLVEEWDTIDSDYQECVGNGESYQVLKVSEEHEEVLLELNYYDENEDDTYYDTHWVPFHCLQKKFVVSFELSDADKKYKDIVMKIRKLQADRKRKGYAF